MNLKADMPEAIALLEKVSSAQDKVVTEFNEVSSGIDDMINMDEFSGAAADSAKGYFENVHQTTVLAFQQLMIEIDKNLKNHINTFHSDVDTSERARVFKHYLEEVKEEIETPFKSLVETNEEVVRTIDDVADIVSVTKPNISLPQSDKDSIVELIEKLIANLGTYTTISNDRVKEMIHHVKALMKEIQSYKGEERFKNVDKSELVDPIRKIMIDEGGIFESLLDKVASNEPLTTKEQSLLYYIFQNVVLTDDTKEEINDITNYMTEENIDKLKDRLNEKVVFSRGTLEREIAIIEAYLYLGGGMKPGQTEILSEDRAKLEAYLMLLKNYENTMGDNTVIIVDRLEYESERTIDGKKTDVTGHFIFSALQTAEYDVDESLMNEQQFRNWRFDPDDPVAKHFSLFDISYYGGTDSTSDKFGYDIAHLKEKETTYTSDFITKKVLGKIMSEAASALKVGELFSLAKDVDEHNAGYQELTNAITVEEGMEAAGRLGMEFGIAETRNIPGPRTPDVNAVQLVPTDKTFETIERWKSIQRDYPHIDFPEKDFMAQNWYEVSEALDEIKDEYGKEASDYIRDETLGINDKNIDDKGLIKELEKKELDRIFGK
ncbi:T7SS effector LXG polymorphic toxin [Pseudogracilibacillus sp. SO30301A]|uniref:T7SS effector LXG polymorphic toxin n=1 Tax=Pseudogracilibacillus sp. SO30301A TaxID=3098291 RepID=UPI00300DFBFF